MSFRNYVKENIPRVDLQSYTVMIVGRCLPF
jgi:hypothetical protein